MGLVGKGEGGKAERRGTVSGSSQPEPKNSRLVKGYAVGDLAQEMGKGNGIVLECGILFVASKCEPTCIYCHSEK